MIELVGNPKYKKVYVSGPITGIEEHNKPEFERMSHDLKLLGFEVINPHKLFSEYEVESILKSVYKKEISEEESWAIFMKRDIKFLVDCNFVAVLKGWQNSKGAKVEVELAKNLFMPIVDAYTLKEVF